MALPLLVEDGGLALELDVLTALMSVMHNWSSNNPVHQELISRHDEIFERIRENSMRCPHCGSLEVTSKKLMSGIWHCFSCLREWRAFNGKKEN